MTDRLPLTVSLVDCYNHSLLKYFMACANIPSTRRSGNRLWSRGWWSRRALSSRCATWLVSCLFWIFTWVILASIFEVFLTSFLHHFSNIVSVQFETTFIAQVWSFRRDTDHKSIRWFLWPPVGVQPSQRSLITTSLRPLSVSCDRATERTPSVSLWSSRVIRTISCAPHENLPLRLPPRRLPLLVHHQ